MNTTTGEHTPERIRNDWDATVKLAVVISLVAGLLAVALADHVASPVLILTVIAVGATLSWRQSGRLAG